MERNGQREAIRLLSGASRASEDDNDHEKPLRQEEGYTSARSSGAYSVADFDSASPSSQAYPSHRVKSALARFSLYIGGSVRRRTVLGLASLVLVSLLFWGFGVHTMLLEEKEKFASSTHTNGQVATAPAATTPATPAGLSGLWDTDLVNDDPAVPAQSAVPAVTFDEHGHNRKPSNESEVCTTWPVDILGRYEAKTIAANQRHKLASHAPAGGWKKPAGLKIVAMIFFGRKRNVDILDCYLRQNLASNGGYLDEVHFMVKTTKEDDIEWLQEFVKTVDEYKFQGLDLCTTANGYGCIWEYANEDDTLYIKIDDDILYIHHDAIPQLVHTRLAVPQPFAVSAQLVNSPVSGLQQYHSGAIHPFIPDPYNYTTRHMGEEWRPSKWGVVAKDMKVATEGVKMDVESPYDGHPWVLMSSSLDDMSTLLKTPIGDWQTHRGDDPAFGPGWKRWAIAAQQEYSLLYNIELNEMDRYHFGRPMRYKTAPPFPIATMTPSEADLLETSSSPPSATGKAMRAPRGQGHQQRSGTINNTHPDVGGENLFDMQYLRYNLNFVAVWGRDVKLGLPVNTDDEADFTQFIPQRLGRPFVIDTRAVVAHNSFFTQLGGIQQTDLLDRWRALANEMACKPDNLKVPWDFRCSGF